MVPHPKSLHKGENTEKPLFFSLLCSGLQWSFFSLLAEKVAFWGHATSRHFPTTIVSKARIRSCESALKCFFFAKKGIQSSKLQIIESKSQKEF